MKGGVKSKSGKRSGGSTEDPFSGGGVASKSRGKAKKSLSNSKEETRRLATAKSERDGAAEMTEIASKLTSHDWYHGMMPREEIEDLLKNDGDFLLRKTDVSKKPRIAISVFSSNRIRHILLNFADQKWFIRDAKMASVGQLVEHHLKNKIPVQNDGTCISHPIPRPDFYILHDHITLGQRLGGGAFGDVHKGLLKRNNETLPVAVKKLKGQMRKKQRTEFVKEAKIMKRFNHKNVVKVYGVAPQEEPLLIVLEFCPGGALNSHLKGHPEVSVDRLCNYAKDACRGMCYLSLRKIIHRDIAARNCLLGKDDEVKISDFGLSVATSELKLDRLSKMPIKWLAPETLRSGVFSTKTDVWSFGVMMWEIFSRCKTDPYPNDNNLQARGKILSGKQPMDAPANTPPHMAAILILCFTQQADQRPSFEALFKIMCPRESPPEPESNDEFMKEIEKFKKEAEANKESKAEGISKSTGNASKPVE
ncbi:unnamed protein product [Bursaphelenchus xylophilus]|uniref:Tyrosine-protein kinase n=1 Tax=Bursaphelenchus xylophilus TaxID=6326 RepID=A0A1I7SW02_BURXY|nr:unnamed protein product [Bursaphelenchus xylophilus]CAG9098590.1 unnamed protein product [Bursaphelenchus xylophilus]